LRCRDHARPSRGTLTPCPFEALAHLFSCYQSKSVFCRRRFAPPATGPCPEVNLPLRSDSLMTKCCSHETLLHFGAQGIISLEYLILPPRSVLEAATPPVTRKAASRPPHTPTRCGIWRRPRRPHPVPSPAKKRGGKGREKGLLATTAEYEQCVSASSIFRAAPFDR